MTPDLKKTIPIQEIELEILDLARRKQKLEKLLALKTEVAVLEVNWVIKVVIEEVCRTFKLPVDELMINRRFESIARPRQIVFYIVREFNAVPFEQIARVFGKTHGTVMCGCRAISDMMSTNKAFAATVETIKLACQKRLAENGSQ